MRINVLYPVEFRATPKGFKAPRSIYGLMNGVFDVDAEETSIRPVAKLNIPGRSGETYETVIFVTESGQFVSFLGEHAKLSNGKLGVPHRFGGEIARHPLFDAKLRAMRSTLHRMGLTDRKTSVWPTRLAEHGPYLNPFCDLSDEVFRDRPDSVISYHEKQAADVLSQTILIGDTLFRKMREPLINIRIEEVAGENVVRMEAPHLATTTLSQAPVTTTKGLVGLFRLDQADEALEFARTVAEDEDIELKIGTDIEVLDASALRADPSEIVLPVMAEACREAFAAHVGGYQKRGCSPSEVLDQIDLKAVGIHQMLGSFIQKWEKGWRDEEDFLGLISTATEYRSSDRSTPFQSQHFDYLMRMFDERPIAPVSGPRF